MVKFLSGSVKPVRFTAQCCSLAARKTFFMKIAQL